MASTYTLPGAAITHSHSHQHSAGSASSHAHSHSPSRSPSSLGTLNRSFKMDTSNGSIAGTHDRKDAQSRSEWPTAYHDTPSKHLHTHNHSHDHLQDHVHDHGHDHSHDDLHDNSHDHPQHHIPNHQHTHTHEHGRGHNHDRQSHSLTPDWASSKINGGSSVITPSDATFAGAYEAPSTQDVHLKHSSAADWSKFTALLLPVTARWPVLHTIMTEKDSRRIFYFMSLNFSFMAVQAFYGYITDSLGLLSDSIHMFFDCVALAVGLFAAVASKWPPSTQFPYGFGKVETLSGFANGIFLILISLEIMFEACERILEGRETKRLTELFIVSSLGLLVNLVGMAAFGHHHHGHDHGHSHSHSHDHSHSHSHSHDHGHGHDHEKEEEKACGHGHDHSHQHDQHGHKHTSSQSNESPHQHAGHSHDHDNENMRGIYLHVLADTMGSAAVIASTVLTHFVPWAGWDPLASFLIAALIMLSAMPLVKSSARRLLLTIPDNTEYNLRNILPGITDLRGVMSYSAPKFWLDDRNQGEQVGGDRLMGVMHILAMRGADVEDVRQRVHQYLADRNIDMTLQVEKEGDTNSWSGTPTRPTMPAIATKREKPLD